MTTRKTNQEARAATERSLQQTPSLSRVRHHAAGAREETILMLVKIAVATRRKSRSVPLRRVLKTCEIRAGVLAVLALLKERKILLIKAISAVRSSAVTQAMTAIVGRANLTGEPVPGSSRRIETRMQMVGPDLSVIERFF